MRRLFLCLFLLSMTACFKEFPNKASIIAVIDTRNRVDTLRVEYYKVLRIDNNGKLIDADDNVISNDVKSFSILSSEDINVNPKKETKAKEDSL